MRNATLASSAFSYDPMQGQRSLQLAIVVPVVVMAVAFLARFYDLTGESIWLDEAYSYSFSRPDLSFKQVIWTTGGDFHPPLYYLILHTSLGFGSDLFWLRLPSVVFGCLAAGMTAIAGRNVGGPAAGLAAGLMYAIAPTQVAYGQEARMYALLSFEICAGLAAFLWLTRDRTRLFAAPFSVLTLQSGFLALCCWLTVSLAIGTAMLTHNLGVYFPIVAGVAVLAIWIGTPDRRFRDLASFTVFSALGTVLWLPWLPYLLKQLKQVSGGYWIVFPTAGTVMTDAVSLTFGTENLLFGTAALLVAVATIVFVAVRRRETTGTLGLLLLFALGPIVLALLISVWRPLYLSRTLVWVAIPIFLAIAYAVVHLHRRAASIMLQIAFVAVMTYHLHLYYGTQSKPGWQETVEHIRSQWRDGDFIAIHRASAALPFDFHRRLAHGQLPDLPEALGILMPKDASVDKLPAGTKRLWLIYSFEDQDDKDRRILKTFTERGHLLESRDFGGPTSLGRPFVALISFD